MADLGVFQEFAAMIGKLLGDEDAPGTISDGS